MNRELTKAFLLLLILPLTFLVVPCWAQSDASIIYSAKRINVSSIDSKLPSIPYKTWLQKTLHTKRLNWMIDDCGESGDGSESWPLCVTTFGAFNQHGEVSISIVVGDSESRVFGKPSLWDIYVEGVGYSRSFRKLSELQDYLKDSEKNNHSAIKFSDRPLDEETAVNFAKDIDIHFSRVQV